ncbi:UNKNOWN [Stylonychia lemnae]|uniref:Transmembrane protein n=1 Tax=Stylonychia lemnae TaxID=5949 RepID=A0A078B6Y4_STYLE|nr:UNKNOWN [Stylonychia lemnae]|eukprot:CDW89951.1 UNKNOWN [Stylonychia lemnae]
MDGGNKMDGGGQMGYLNYFEIIDGANSLRHRHRWDILQITLKIKVSIEIKPNSHICGRLRKLIFFIFFIFIIGLISPAHSVLLVALVGCVNKNEKFDQTKVIDKQIILIKIFLKIFSQPSQFNKILNSIIISQTQGNLQGIDASTKSINCWLQLVLVFHQQS